jgi:hypothetical protein
VATGRPGVMTAPSGKWLGIATDIEDEKILRNDLRRAVQEAAEARAMLRSLQPGLRHQGSDESSFKPPCDL